MRITEDLLRKIASIKDVDRLLIPLEETMKAYKITSPARQMCFLSQTGHESGGFFYTEELASGKAYEGRRDLGNTHTGDGVKYKGRGIIQITGRSNYAQLSKDLGVDFINVPTLLGAKNFNLCSPTQLQYAVMAAGWYWEKNKLNEICDKIDVRAAIDKEPNLIAFKQLTKRINGYYNGLSDRVARFKILQQFIDDEPHSLSWAPGSGLG